MQRKIKVLIVDDSALVRQILVEILKTAKDMEVVGTASDPFVARERIKETNPDVLTLDVEMPRMDGLTFLANLMRLRPMPVVMVSSLTERGAETTLKALELGAIDFVSKPKIDVAGTLRDFSDEILDKIRVAAGARVHARIPPSMPANVPPKHSADAILPANSASRMLRTTDRIIAVGASTGGTEAIRELLTGLPAGGWSFALEPGACLDFVPVDEAGWCVRFYGFDDAFKGSIGEGETEWLGAPAPLWFARRGIDMAAAGIAPETDLQMARVFPVGMTPPSSNFVEWLFSSKPVTDAGFAERWLAAERFSAQEIGERANLPHDHVPPTQSSQEWTDSAVET